MQVNWFKRTLWGLIAIGLIFVVNQLLNPSGHIGLFVLIGVVVLTVAEIFRK